MEGLEQRKLLTGGVYLTEDHVIVIHGTDHGDGVAIYKVKGADASLDKVNVDWTHDNTTEHFSYNAKGIRGITFSGGSGNDYVTNGTNIPSNLYGGDGNDTLIGGSATDRIDGGDGNDFLAGGAGDDFIIGGRGNNTLIGNAGNDTLYAFAPGGRKVGQLGLVPTNNVYGGDGNDTIFGACGAINYLHGGNGNDTIVGNDDAINYIYGDAGNDKLFGRGVFNYMNGGTGSDQLEAQTPASTNYLDGGTDTDTDYFYNMGVDTSVPTTIFSRPGDKSVGTYAYSPHEDPVPISAF